MGLGIATEAEREQLAHYLRQRQSKEQLVALLDSIKTQNDLKQGEVTVAKSATYDKIVESIDEALKNDWLDRSTLLEILDQAELAGRQHVMLYAVKPAKVNNLRDILLAPKHKKTRITGIEEYWELPDNSFARVVRDDGEAAVVKIVARRSYHRIELLEEKDDYEVFKKLKQTERAAIILKLNRRLKLFQVRVPPKEQGGSDTPTRVYSFARDAIDRHFDLAAIYSAVDAIPISDVFTKVVKNRKDFVMEHDSPDNGEVRTSMTRKRNLNGEPNDLRDSDEWDFENGYARSTVRGSWTINDQKVFVHINQDNLRIDPKNSTKIGRLFFPNQCSDAEIDHVINRIREHLA